MYEIFFPCTTLSFRNFSFNFTTLFNHTPEGEKKPLRPTFEQLNDVKLKYRVCGVYFMITSYHIVRHISPENGNICSFVQCTAEKLR